MDLKMEVYSPHLELLGLLEIQNSIIWERKAFSAGSFSLSSLITEETLSLLVPENIIWIAGEDAGIIEYVQEEAGENGPYISVKGCDLTGILARRILWGRYDLSGPVPELMYRLVDDCCINPTRGNPPESRVIPGLVLAGTAPTGGPPIRAQKTGGELLEALEELGETYQVPFGVRFNPAVPQMEFWARYGVNRSVNQNVVEPVFYSTELDDVLSSEYSYNAQDYRNVALVAGEGEGNDRVMVTVNGNAEPDPVPPTQPTPTYTINLSVDPEGGGLASGGGVVSEGQSVTVTATPSDGYSFTGWQENGETVSEEVEYTFTATGDRALTAVFAVVSRVPEGYTEVEYIESTNGQYINIGDFEPNYRLVLDFYPESTINIYGSSTSVDGTSSNISRYFAGFNLTNGGPSVNYYSAGLYRFSTDETKRRILLDADSYRNVIAYDGNERSFTPLSGCKIKVKNFLLFAYSSNYLDGDFASPQGVGNAKLYMCQIYQNTNTLIHDFVPCIRIADNTPGLYDLIGKVFYQSETTDKFVAGPAV